MKTILLTILLGLSVLGFSQQPDNISRIIMSGDGKGPETAFEVYSTKEQYDLLKYFKLTPEIHMLCMRDGESYDIFKIQENKIWFKVVSKKIIS